MTRNILFLFLFTFYFSISIAQEASSVSESTEETTLQPIAINDITNSANNVQINLDKINKQLQDKKDLEVIKANLKVLLDSIDLLKPDKVIDNLNQFNSRQLYTISQKWKSLNNNLKNFKTSLSESSTILENAELEMLNMRDVWELTAKTVYVSDIPTPVRKRVYSVINEIKKTEKNIGAKSKSVLLMQESISTRELQIVRLLTAIEEIETKELENIFSRDNLPFFKAIRIEKDSSQVNTLNDTITDVIASNSVFINENKIRFVIHVILLLIFIGYFYFLRYKVNHNLLIIKSENYTLNLLHFVKGPISSGTLLAVFSSIWLYPNSSLDFGHLVVVISFIPTIFLVPILIDKHFHRITFLIIGLAVFNYLRIIVSFDEMYARITLIMVNVLAISLPILLFFEKRKVDPEKRNSSGNLIFKIAPLIFIALVTGVALNLYGTVNLSRNILNAIILGLYLGLIFIFSDEIFTGLSGILFRRQRKNAFLRISEYAPRIEHTLERIIHVIIFFYWFRATSSSIGVFEILENWYDGLLNLSWQVGKPENKSVLKLSTIIDFVLILISSSIIARALRVILDLEVFSRVKLPRGVAGTISMVTRYTIVGFGIFLAISTVTDLSKLGVMTGAIGVGLGFGLQGVIANFVSGIIISFERPMQVGDMVEINNIQGNVDEIGVRSSTIKTFDGSEVIVPNNDFISTQFTNWTLTDPKRRIKLNIKVALSANPHKVIEMLSKILEEHPGVHTQPEPVVTFDGFGDYYLDFTLYYWISENILQYKSEIALQVYDSVLEADLQVPVPKQDLNINVNKNVDNTLKS